MMHLCRVYPFRRKEPEPPAAPEPPVVHHHLMLDEIKEGFSLFNGIYGGLYHHLRMPWLGKHYYQRSDRIRIEGFGLDDGRRRRTGRWLLAEITEIAMTGGDAVLYLSILSKSEQ